jgi:hypothetical protein
VKKFKISMGGGCIYRSAKRSQILHIHMLACDNCSHLRRREDILVISGGAKSNSILLHGAFVLPPKFVGMFSHEPPWIKLKIITFAVLSLHGIWPAAAVQKGI